MLFYEIVLARDHGLEQGKLAREAKMDEKDVKSSCFMLVFATFTGISAVLTVFCNTWQNRYSCTYRLSEPQ